MSHRVGALLMPVPPPSFGPTRPGESNTASLDPALSILGAFFKAMLEHYAGQAWAAIAPKEPVVRVLSAGHDPEDIDFSDNDTPLLALWRDGATTPTRLDDGNAQQSSQVSVLWVAAPADEQKLAARSPFFNAFSKAMLLAYQNERDPCWIRRGEETNVISRTYGSYVWGLAGIDGWSYLGTERTELMVQTGGQSQPFPGYLARWTILESTDNDPEAFCSTIAGERVGSEETVIRFDVTDGDDLVRQSAKVPVEPDEEP